MSGRVPFSRPWRRRGRTVRLGDLRAATANRINDESLIEKLLAGYGTTTSRRSGTRWQA